MTYKKHNHAPIINDLKDKILTHQEIANNHNISRATVFRIAKKHGLGKGQGIRYYWQFSKSTKSIAYIVGILLTDGGFMKGTIDVSGILAYTTTNKIANRFEQALKETGFQYARDIRTGRKGGIIRNGKPVIGKRPALTIRCHSSMFSRWLYKETNEKQRIPNYLFNAPQDHKITFLEGLIDGDGTANKTGSVILRSSGEWMKQIPEFLDSMDIRYARLYVARTLDSGKSYYRICIKRIDLVANHFQCAHPVKLQRIYKGFQLPTSPLAA